MYRNHPFLAVNNIESIFFFLFLPFRWPQHKLKVPHDAGASAWACADGGSMDLPKGGWPGSLRMG